MSRIRRRLAPLLLVGFLALVGWILVSKMGNNGIREHIYAEQMTADLFRFRRAQTAYHAQHGTYAQIRQLETFSSTPGVEVQIEALDEVGVIAIARHWDTELSCRMIMLDDPVCLVWDDVELATSIRITSSGDFR
jgi:hypothetical protein